MSVRRTVFARLRLGIGVATALVAGSAASSAHATFPGQNGKIAFAQSDIYVINPDGSGRTRLTSDSCAGSFPENVFPRWSPDGRRIVYASLRPRAIDACGQYDVFVMNADGSGQTRLTSTVDVDESPSSWSPDGSKILVTRGASTEAAVYVMNADGTGEVRLTDGGAAVWSPDGREIIFARRHADTNEVDLYSMNPDGSTVTNLTNSATTEENAPNWSSNATRLAFERAEKPNLGGRFDYDIYTMNPGGAGLVQRTDTSSIEESNPVWSPDSTSIAFDTGNGIHIMDPATGDVLTITTGQEPDWQPSVPGYARPKGATPIRVSLVPAYDQCASPNRIHGPSLAFSSCDPPVQSSSVATVGTPHANGAAARSIGSTRYDVQIGNPATSTNEADVIITVGLTDVRRQDTLADYTGQLQATSTVRITDRFNGTPGAESGTVADLEFPVTVPCVATRDPSVGATCSIVTTFDAVSPGAIVEGQRAIWQLDRVRIYDGGADGIVATVPNSLFATQGVFIP